MYKLYPGYPGRHLHKVHHIVSGCSNKWTDPMNPEYITASALLWLFSATAYIF